MYQNVSEEDLLKEPKVQAKITKKLQSLRRLLSGRRTVIHPPSKNEGPKDIEDSMSMVLDIKKFVSTVSTVVAV